MELNINSPAYYTNIYGVDDEVCCMCQDIFQYFKDKKYSDYINIIGIVPIVAPEEEVAKGLWKEIKKVEIKNGFASVSLRIDYSTYINSAIEKKKGLVIDNILKSIKAIKGRAKIDYKMFENDMRLFCKSNNILFDIKNIEKLLFEQTIDVSNYIALKDFDYLFDKGFLKEFSKSDILSVLNDYGGDLSVIDKKRYFGRFDYSLYQDNRYKTEIDLMIDDCVCGLTLFCEFNVENNRIIDGLIEDIRFQ